MNRIIILFPTVRRTRLVAFFFAKARKLEGKEERGGKQERGELFFFCYTGGGNHFGCTGNTVGEGLNRFLGRLWIVCRNNQVMSKISNLNRDYREM